MDGEGAGERAVGAAAFQRAERLLGKSCMDRLARSRVILFGLGGVGSWCAESLVRTGVSRLTLVDSDRICVTNINRQLQATWRTVGEVKTEALKARLLEINPQVQIEPRQMIYDTATQDAFDLASYDVIIDAIDSIYSKALLLHNAVQTQAQVFSSFGAALKLDPARVRVAEFHAVRGCPLGSRLRKIMRREFGLPSKPVMVVYSDEQLGNHDADIACGSGKCLCPRGEGGLGDPGLAAHEWCSRKAVINGSLAHITGIFGLTLAGLVIQSLYSEGELPPS